MTTTRGRSGRTSDEVPLVERARNGDVDAFEVLVKDSHERLKAVAWHIVRDDETAFDVLQEAYLRAWRGLEGFRGDAAIGTWLHRIVVTTALNQVRQRRPVPVDLGDRDVPSAEPGVGERVTECDRVSAVLDGLSGDHRAVVVLVDLHGYSYAEAGELLGIGDKTVSSRLTRARHELRTALTEEEQP